MDKVAIMVVTYNRKALLTECIEAILKQTFSDFDLLVLDNASTDGTGERVLQFADRRIQYINTGTNLGGAGGFAFGMNYILKEGRYQYAWLMDDDTVPTAAALESLCRKANQLKAEFSFLASVVKWTDGSACLMNMQIPASDAIMDMKAIDLKLIRIKRSSFVSCFINLNCAAQVGLPIREFFIYGDDVEYTQRLSAVKSGYLDLDSMVVHKMEYNAQAGLDCCPDERIDRCYFERRNALYIARKGDMKDKAWYVWISMKILKGIVKRAPSRKGRRMAVFFRGTLAGIFFNPAIVKEYR